MNKKAETFQFEYYKSSTVTDFTELEQELIKDTIKKAKNAYAPYSNFNVSAGLLLIEKTILSAINVENTSYQIGTCTERNVLS